MKIVERVRWFFERHPETHLPIFFLVLYMLFFYTAGQFLFQNTKEILEQVRELYSVWGLALVFFGGFTETLFMVGIYLPTSLTIAFGIIVDPTLPNVFWVGAMCVLSALCANIINFVIGKYGFANLFNFLGAKQILAAQSNKRNDTLSILLSCANPNLLGVAVVYHAMRGMPFTKLIPLSFLSTLIWVPILSVVAVVLGEEILTENSGLVFLYFFLGWIGYLVVAQEVKYFLDKRKTSKSKTSI